MVMENFLAQTFGKSQMHTDIANRLYKEYDVKKGLRNEDGTGVRIGLTKISDVVGYEFVDGVKNNIPGLLYYRGYNVLDIVRAKTDEANGFEEVVFLLLFGYLPAKGEFEEFLKVIRAMYELPDDFLEINLLRMPGKNLMNTLQHAVLSLYNYDRDPDNVEVFSTLIKGLSISSKLPAIMCYAYQSKMHYFNRDSLVIHYSNKEFSTAQNILHLLRPNKKFSEKEASLLDTILLLQADHGGGNNSTFTNVVVSSTGTDIYSSVSASIGSLKGPRHGGANIRVAQMMDAVIEAIGYSSDDLKIRALVEKILDKDFFDKTGLVYGFGHAVYTLSDPRAELLREYCRAVAEEKDKIREYEFYVRFERIVKEVIFERKGNDISTNVDFYSGFAYELMDIPRDLFTPLFVCARCAGWLAHNIENKLYDGRIMRPATKYVGSLKEYMLMKDR
ncbi:MAG: citrate synthase [Johnsonella sp.]|nr:citrate synthase [Johnsonella sp.]